MFECELNMYLPIRHDANAKESMLNNSESNLLDSTNTGWPFSTAFSPQSGNIQGLHNVYGNYSMTSIPTSLSSRNSGFGGLSSSGVHQASGSLSSGRFASNNIPVALSQLSHGGLHGHTGMANRGGNAGPRMTSSVGGIVGGAGAGGSLGRTLSIGGGQTVLGSTSRGGSGGIGVQGPGRPMNSVSQQGSAQVVSLLGNTFSTSVGAMNPGQASAVNGQQISIGISNDANSNDSAPFDISDFPQLTSHHNSGGGPQGQLASIRKQGTGVSSLAQQNQEFSIQIEDFPALPGFKGNADYTMDLHQKDHHHENAISLMQSQHYSMRSAGLSLGSYASHRQQRQQQAPIGISTNTAGGGSFAPSDSAEFMHFHGSDPSASYHSQAVPVFRSVGLTNTMPGLGSYDQVLQQYQQPLNHSHFRHVSVANQLSREGLKPISGLQAAPDLFGLVGLLSVIRMNCPDLTTLALGIDLTTLGLNLNSRDNLYKTFASPWADGPAKGEPEYSLPQCYSQQAPRLQQAHFAKFSRENLFYIFYSMPNEEAQLFAANELYNKGWIYHRELRLWLTRVLEPLVTTSTYERGSYIYFDPNTWDFGQKDNYVLYYDMLEKKPQLPKPSELQQAVT